MIPIIIKFLTPVLQRRKEKFKLNSQNFIIKCYNRYGYWQVSQVMSVCCTCIAMAQCISFQLTLFLFLFMQINKEKLIPSNKDVTQEELSKTVENIANL